MIRASFYTKFVGVCLTLVKGPRVSVKLITCKSLRIYVIFLKVKGIKNKKSRTAIKKGRECLYDVVQHKHNHT